MGLREKFAASLKEAMKTKDARRLSTVRLVQAAVKDRDIANRTAGKEPVSDEEIMRILAKMIRQREESAGVYEEAGRHRARPAGARGNRDHPAVHAASSCPRRRCRNCASRSSQETGAQGLRDMGKCMNKLKERYPGQMDFSKASGMVKGLLR